jgi:stage III sporulation protein AE
MKRVIFLLLTIVILTVDAGAFDLPEELEDALPETAEVFMKHADLSGVDGFVQSLGGMAGQVGAQLSGIVRQRMKGAASILLVVILCGLTEGILAGTGNKQSFFSMAGALTISLLTARSLDQLIGLGADTIRELTLFSKTLLPTMAAATATSGALVTATVQQAMTLFLVDVLLNLISTCLLPLVYLYIGVLTASCCLQDGRIGLVAETLRKGLVWVLTTVLIGFTVYLSMVHIVSGAADGSKVRLAKSAISGMVPVVGKVVADAAETVLAGAGMLKNTIGIFGMLGIFALCIHPFVQLGIQYLLYKISAFLAGMIGSPGICKLIDGLGSAFGLVLGMTGACAMLLLVSVLALIAAVIP